MRQYIDAAVHRALGAVEPARRVRAAKRLALSGDWDELLAISEHVEPSESRLLLLRLTAAINLGNISVTRSIIELAVGGHIDRKTALAMGNRLLDNGNVNEAWEVFSAMFHAGAPLSRSLLKRIVLGATDPAVQQAAESILQRLDAARAKDSAQSGILSTLKREKQLSPVQRYAIAMRKAAEADWQGVLDVTDEMAGAPSRLLLLRTVAAIQAKHDAAINSVVEICLTGTVKPQVALTISSRLIGDHRTFDAWRILSVMPPQEARTHRALLKRLTFRASEPDVRSGAIRLLRELEGTAAPLPDAATEAQRWSLAAPYSFMTPIDPKEDAGVGFTLSLVNPGRVAAFHEGEYQKAMDRFDDALRNWEEPRVVEYKDVLVNRLGQIWRADGTIIRSAERQLPEGWSTRHADSVDEAVLCTNSTRGIYHWYAERLPSLGWRLAPGAPTPPILIGSHAAAFQDETFRLLGVPSEQVIRIDDIFHCRRALVAEMPLASVSQWSRFSFIYDRLVAAAAAEQHGVESPKRIYISRRDTNRRRLLNEGEIEDGLSRRGVTPLLFSKMSLAAQIMAVRNADFVVGAHGAGLTHLLVHQTGLQVLEVHPVQTGSHFLRLSMARLSRLRGHHHTLWLEPVNPVTLEWTAETEGFLAQVERMMSCLPG